jgi:hypothetical protein
MPYKKAYTFITPARSGRSRRRAGAVPPLTMGEVMNTDGNPRGEAEPGIASPKDAVRKARGCGDHRRPGFKQIAIQFESETFDELAGRAVGERLSFGELVRTYCEWGLETAEAGAAALHNEAAKALKEAFGQAGKPADRFPAILRAAFRSLSAHAADRRRGAPENAAAWGWREIGPGTLIPCGPRVAWVDGEDLYLEPAAAFAAVQGLAERKTGRRLDIRRDTLIKRLHERGLLASTDGPGRLQIRQTLDGERRRVLHFSVRTVLGRDGG